MIIMFEKSPEVSVIIDFVKSLQPETVLEIGCNFGRELKHLEGLSNLYGIDTSSEKIEKAKAYVKGIFRIAEASQIPYKDKKFDFVYSTGVLAHSPPEKIKFLV